MAKLEIIKVQGFSVNVQDDYICLTDMAKADGDDARAADLIRNWLNNKSTIDFLGTWEAINNPDFKVLEFQHFRDNINTSKAISVVGWIEATGAIGVFSRQGRGGGTYAHKDIAFEFGTAISPVFKLYLIKEFQRLKEAEQNKDNIDWNVRRLLSKAHYHVQTDAIKKYKIPDLALAPGKEFIAYAEEGDILNLAIFGFTAKMWKEANIELAAKGMNPRDFASINELAVLASLEGINAEMIKQKLDFKDRLNRLRDISASQMETLSRVNPQNNFRKKIDGTFESHVNKNNKMFPSPDRQEELKDSGK